MKLIELLINVLREIMYEYIDKFGVLHEITIDISQRLDYFIEIKQKQLI